MSALPFLFMVGIDPSGSVASLLVSLYIAQDGFGTATNVSGNNVMAIVIDEWFGKNVEDTGEVDSDREVSEDMK